MIKPSSPVVTDPPNVTAEATAVDTPIADVTLGTATATDIFPVTITNDAPATFPLGDTLVHWTATDTSDNSATTSTQTVTIVDTTSPVVADPPNVIAEATGITTPVDIGIAAATDIFEPITITNDAPATFPLGTTEVHWTATDANGNSASTGTQLVTVEDTTPPVFDPISDITVDATSFDGAIADYGLPTASDIVDSSPLVSCEPASGSQFPVGDTIVECIATDFSENSAGSSFSITVNPFATPGKVTAGGAQLNKDINFGFNIQSDDAVTFKGELQYSDKSAGIKLHSEEMIRLAIIPGGTTAQLAGIAKDGSTFTILVEDNGEPGKNDFFSITIKDSDGLVIYEQEGNLSKGNIQIHKEKSKN